MHADIDTDILIVGGGTGGVAAALAVADAGHRCVLTETTDWLGGQLTAQAVPPDENRWIEGDDTGPAGLPVDGGTRSYRRFREAVREHVRAHRRLTAEARSDPRLNPGGGWVSRLCYEPAVGKAVIDAMLAPHVASGAVTLRLNHTPIEADVEGDRVRAVTFHDAHAHQRVTVAARYVLDATELGDLLPLTGAEHTIGAESQAQTGETHALTGDPDPTDQQAVTWVFALEHRPGEDHTLDKPAGYDAWASFVPDLDPPWPGPLFSWTICGDGHQPRRLGFTPWPDTPSEGELELWRYRRVIDRSIHDPDERGDRPPDVTLVNWVQNDYFLSPLLGVSPDQPQKAIADAREQARCLLYWMQTDAPRHDGDATGYPGLRLHPASMGTPDGFARSLYVREARRLDAVLNLSEAHVGADHRRHEGHRNVTPLNTPAAEAFPDAVGIGHYPIDLHPSTAGRNQLYVEACPFQLPLRSLVPRRLTNLLSAGKGLGVTHIANGCTRLHPVEWNVGEAAAALAAHCLDADTAPHALATGRPAAVEPLQKTLTARGIPLAWPWA